MRFLRSALLPAALGIVVAGCAASRPTALPRPSTSTDGTTPSPVSGFVTRLGADTVAVEQFAAVPDGYTATVLVRVPTTMLVDYRLRLDAEGGLVDYEAVSRRVGQAEPVRRETARRDGDSLRVEVTTPEGTRRRAFAASPAVLPFAEYTHWPFDPMLARAREADATWTEHPLFTERGLVTFAVAAGEGDSVSVVHPTRGTMRALADPSGRLLRLDAAATTRKLTVERVERLDLAALAARFAARDAAGQGFGALSGRVRSEHALGEATVRLDYGQPAARGRALFGTLVPWDERWRTGADQATHFETDRDLRLGAPGADLVVPAGRYTLSTLPAPDGGLLIVNRQTGQTGTSYDAARDLGRVPMQRLTGQPYAERLAFAVDGGLLRIAWGTEAFVVPVRLAQ